MMRDIKLKKKVIFHLFSRLGIIFGVAVLAFLFSLQCTPNIWNDGDSGTDSSVFRMVAMMMDRGYMPYRDTFDHKGPLIYILNWLGMRLSYYRGIWLVELITIFVTFLFIYKIVRLLCGKLMSFLILVVVASSLYQYFEGGNLVEEFALPFITVSLYYYTKYLLGMYVSGWQVILCGVCFGAVCLLRPNMIAIWGIFSITVVIKCLISKQYKTLLTFCSLFCAGVVIFISPILIWLLAKGAFSDFFYDYIIFNLKYSKAGTESALMQFMSFTHFLNDTLILFSFTILGYILLTDRFLAISYGCSFLLTLYAISISGQTYGHYGMILVPLLAYPLGMLGKWSETGIRGKTGAISLFVVIYMMVIFAAPKWIDGIEHAAICWASREENHRSELTECVVDFVVNNTEEDDEITVLGNWDIVYVLSKRAPASEYSYQFPISKVDPAIMERYFQELKNAPPKLIVWREEQDEKRMWEFIVEYSYQQFFLSEEGVRIFMR